MYLVWAGDVPLSSKLEIRDIDSMEEECSCGVKSRGGEVWSLRFLGGASGDGTFWQGCGCGSGQC